MRFQRYTPFTRAVADGSNAFNPVRDPDGVHLLHYRTDGDCQLPGDDQNSTLLLFFASLIIDPRYGRPQSTQLFFYLFVTTFDLLYVVYGAGASSAQRR